MGPRCLVAEKTKNTSSTGLPMKDPTIQGSMTVLYQLPCMKTFAPYDPKPNDFEVVLGIRGLDQGLFARFGARCLSTVVAQPELQSSWI